MSLKVIPLPIPSSWPVPARNRLMQHTPASSTLTVLFPGAVYPYEAPLLWYAQRGALAAGSDVLGLEYGYWAAHEELDFDEDRERMVDEALAAISAATSVSSYLSMVFVSKSMGTYMAGQAAKRLADIPIRHLFLTPVPATIPFMQEQGGVVVVGGDDDVFPSHHIATIENCPGLSVTVIPGANHALEVKDIARSLAIVEQVTDACARLVTP